MPTLRIYLPGSDRATTVKIAKDAFTIGRSRGADVRLPLTTVSKTHAVVERKGGRFFFRDCGSRNGVCLNGFRLERGAIEDGDELGIGGARLVFYRGEPPPDLAGALEGSEPVPESPAAPEAEPDFAETVADDTPLVPEAAPLPRPAEAKPHPRFRLPPPPRRRGLPAPAVTLLVALSLGGGLGLGFLASRLDPLLGPPPEPKGPGGEEAAERPLLGGPAPLDDPQTAHRLVFRLCIDQLGRTPLRSELARLVALPAEEIWLAVEAARAKEAPGEPTVPGDPGADFEGRVAAIFGKFLGRAPEPGEVERALEVARGDPLHLAFYVATSSEYAGPGNRRPRSIEQVARSIYADILDRVPTAAEAKAVAEALRDAAVGRRRVAELLVARAAVGPPAGEEPEAWCRETFLRFALRLPSEAESAACAEAVRAGPEGWKALLVDLVAAPAYVEK
ncbi:MAG: FHA domain-containing protein [Planctomycetota bacterium]